MKRLKSVTVDEALNFADAWRAKNVRVLPVSSDVVLVAGTLADQLRAVNEFAKELEAVSTEQARQIAVTSECESHLRDAVERLQRDVSLLLAERNVLRHGAERYETVRRLNVTQFQDLFLRNLRGEGSFDDLVDAFSHREVALE